MAISSAQTQFTTTTTAPRGTGSSFSNLVSQIAATPSYTNGTTAGAADVPYNATLSVASGSPLAIDLNAGTIKQDDGVTVASFAKLTKVCVQYNSGTGVLTGGGGTNTLPNIAFVLSSALATYYVEDPTNGVSTLTAGTADILNVSSSSGTIVFTIMLLGRSV